MGVEARLREVLTDEAGGTAVSMRELNQKTRAVVDRVVKEGVALTVTDRGKPIAEIHPVRPKAGLDRLEQLGLLAQRGKPFEEGWRPAASGVPLDAWLDEERGEDRLERVMADLRELGGSGADGGEVDG